METWELLRLVKFLGLALLAGGLGLAAWAPGRAQRVSAAWTLVPAGTFLSWVAGYGLLKLAGGSMGAPWVSVGMLGGLVALHGALLCARTDTPRRARAVVAWAGFGVATGAMVGRADPGTVALGALLGGVGAGLAAALVPVGASAPEPAPPLPAAFWWWTRLEALSAAVLFLVYMPAKYALDVNLDGGTGTVGWIHGVLTIIFLNGLVPASRLAGWDRRTTVLAAVASFFPLGGFVYEAWLTRRDAATAPPPRA